ncbi:MAG: sulfatase [Candidatus Eisenbacteria bacterium]
MERRWKGLQPILLWELAAGLAVSTVGGAVTALLNLKANAYLSQGLPNAALYTARMLINRWEAFGLAVTALVALATLICFLASKRARVVALFVAVPVGILVSYLTGYDINRYDFKSYWLAPKSVMGIPLKAALLDRKVVLANIGVLVVSALAGWVAYKLVMFAVRRLGSRSLKTRVPLKPQWLAVAIIAVLIGFNVFGVLHYWRHKAEGPNVILISLDTLRRDHLGCYGYDRPTSPSLDAFAASGVLFENAVTQAGSTLSSHKSVMTSIYPPLLRKPRDQRLDLGRTTISEILLDKGYRTAAFANGLGWVTPVFRFDQGFDRYVVPSRRIVPKLASAEEITQLGLSWVRRHSHSSFFLFLHYGDVHSDWGNLPYDAPEPYGSMFVPPGSERFDRSREEIRGSNYLSAINWGRYSPSGEEIEYIKALYDGGIRYTDLWIGNLMQALADLGVLDRSLVVIFSDHGEEFREHGRMLHGWVYCEVARVPLLIRFPQGKWAGTRVAGLVELMDIAPTILGSLGIAPGRDMRGRNLVSAVTGGGTDGDAFTEGEDAYSLRTDDSMLLLDFEDGHKEMYDLQADPTERSNVLGRDAESERALEKTLLGWIGTVEAQALRTGESEPAKLDRKTHELLKSLGYLQTGK